jgi:transcriptional regulator with GAF, ATPase, and Fis domain
MIERSTGAQANPKADWLELESLISHPRIAGLVGNSSALQTVATAIARLSPHKGTVLILGESGTGKEVVAEALHRMGPSSAGPLVKFNCSNLLSGLAESQLFGHVRGAFTDAREAYDGCFRQAHGGTLLLDEVGELPLRMQSKILRAVENLEVQPVGSSETFSLDLRILVATNRDLRAMVAAGEFRADLYYRLDVATIRTPPLRQRLEDTRRPLCCALQSDLRQAGALDLARRTGHPWRLRMAWQRARTSAYDRARNTSVRE